MSISQTDVKHIADLARIELTAIEEQKFEKELSAILGFVEKLNGANTTGVELLSGGTILENAMRPDEQIDLNLQEKAAELLEAAPEKKDGWIKVRAVFE